jgi:hypothetical protein
MDAHACTGDALEVEVGEVVREARGQGIVAGGVGAAARARAREAGEERDGGAEGRGGAGGDVAAKGVALVCGGLELHAEVFGCVGGFFGAVLGGEGRCWREARSDA